MISRRSFFKKSILSLLGAGTLFFYSSFFLKNPGTEKIDLRFLVASDGHYGQELTPYKQNFEKLVQWIKEEKNKKGLDFCIFNGDLSFDNPDYLPEVKKYFDRIELPYYTVRGNHDIASPNSWKILWGIPENYSFHHGKNGFIILSTSDTLGKYLCADQNFLQETLEKFKRKKSVFIFMHIPQFMGSEGALNCAEVCRIIDRYSNIKAIFHGHNHNEDSVMIKNGKLYFFDAHFGGSWGTEYHGYRIVEIMHSGLIRTYQFNPELQTFVNKNEI